MDLDRIFCYYLLLFLLRLRAIDYHVVNGLFCGACVKLFNVRFNAVVINSFAVSGGIDS